MTENLSREKVTEILSKLEHPEINSTLVNLGMLHDITYDKNAKEASMVLALPMLNIPEAVRNHLVYIIYLALEPLGITPKIYLAQMTDEEREKFFVMSKQNWREEFLL